MMRGATMWEFQFGKLLIRFLRWRFICRRNLPNLVRVDWVDGDRWTHIWPRRNA